MGCLWEVVVIDCEGGGVDFISSVGMTAGVCCVEYRFKSLGFLDLYYDNIFFLVLIKSNIRFRI